MATNAYKTTKKKERSKVQGTKIKIIRTFCNRHKKMQEKKLLGPYPLYVIYSS